MTERTEDAQSQALRAFLLLCALGQDWQGRLVLVQGLNAEGRAMSVAASIAGAACLALDSRAEVCRATLRAGACDFVVNTVDEALRILKNEIRKRKPVSVALAIPETAALAELGERGVIPDVFLISGGFEAQDAASTLAALGTEVLGGEVGKLPPEFTAEHYAVENGFQLQEYRFATAEELQSFDRGLAGVLPEADPRRRWASRAAGFFYRDRPHRRVAYLTADEAARLG
jgi:urocanate hydratase